ncbi:MAG: hypothetical protein HPY89_04810 [Pelotomaculum sp.]|nr:hypothetical protein [Pelotomaculum sp.]
MDASGGVPGWLKSYFWDVNIRDLDLKANRVFIIERLLNEGNHAAVRWLFRTYSEGDVKEAVLKSRGLSMKTARCWQNYFGLREEEMRCFGTSSTGLKKSF